MPAVMDYYQIDTDSMLVPQLAVISLSVVKHLLGFKEVTKIEYHDLRETQQERRETTTS